MSATAEDVTVDLAAADAEAGKKPEKTPAAAAGAPTVVVDPEVTTATGEKETLTPEEGIARLQRELDGERAARQSAEARANEAARGEAEARGREQTSQLDLLKNAITTVNQQNDALETEYANAMVAQDFATAAKVQRKMADNSAKLAQLEAGKARLESAPKPTPRAPTDPVEAFCAQLTAPSAEWVRKRPEFVTDKAKYAQMIAAHELAIAKGIKADTPEYFASIERTLDLTEPAQARNGNGAHHIAAEAPTADAAAVATGGRQAAPAAAPVSRSGNGANGGRPNTVRLTAAEVEMAQNMGMTPEEYALNKVQLQKEGKLQ